MGVAVGRSQGSAASEADQVLERAERAMTILDGFIDRSKKKRSTQEGVRVV